MSGLMRLRVCPFCKNPPTIFQNEAGKFNVFCEADEFNLAAEYVANTCPVLPASRTLYDTLEEAIAAWNTRPIEDELLIRAEKAEAEVKRLQDAINSSVADIALRSLNFDAGHIDLVARHPMFYLFIASIGDMFVEMGVENYLEMQLISPTIGGITLTMRKQNGKTPNQLKLEAIARAEKAEAEAKELLDVVIDLVNQACTDGDTLNSWIISAYADGIQALAKRGIVTILHDDLGRVVIAKWANKDL